MTQLGTPVEWVDTPEALAAAAARWRQAPVLGIDSEFVRERTFFPRLGLLQVADGAHSTLLDPVALADLEPLRAVLADPSIVKVAHSPSEDMEVLFHRFGEFPAPLFDTQGAAALVGYESAMSYQRLVRELLGIELAKGETRTDWLRRPLSAAQVEYAAQDVELLLPLYRQLRPKLEERGRLAWLLEEAQRLREPARFLPPPEDAYLRLGGLGSLDRRQLAALRALAAWRERQARERDLPRNFVLKEAAMVTMARRQPQALADLAGTPELPPKQIERYGETLLRLIREARHLPAEEMPAPRPKGARDERGRELLDRLVEVVRQRAETIGVTPTLLASRRDLKHLLTCPAAALPPPALAGWRWEQIGNDLAPLLEEARSKGVMP
ncbi:MAG TPA: ribonuclease D [Thermoanaerobaculia bacterium]|jgi:ribonuclease D|nr:ribonuclease D [Thermoanaerobaculia bacterium]